MVNRRRCALKTDESDKKIQILGFRKYDGEEKQQVLHFEVLRLNGVSNEEI